MQVPGSLWAGTWRMKIFEEGITNRSRCGTYTLFICINLSFLPEGAESWTAGWLPVCNQSDWSPSHNTMNSCSHFPPPLLWIDYKEGEKCIVFFHCGFRITYQSTFASVCLHVLSRTKTQCEKLKNPSSCISLFHYISLRFMDWFPFEKWKRRVWSQWLGTHRPWSLRCIEGAE